MDDGVPKYSREEVARHNTRRDCWTIVDGSVYDVTPLLSTHPGGQGALLDVAGKDGTSSFKSNHDKGSNAFFKIGVYFIGHLKK